MKSSLVTLLLLLPGSAAFAGPVIVERYVDPQGVEIIHNRRQPALTAAAGPLQMPATVDIAPPKAASKVQTAKVRVLDDLDRDSRFRISSSEQAMRDGDRAMILQEELLIESQKYEEKRKRLNVQRLRDSGAVAELSRLQDELNAHQQNIQSLNAELRRTAHQARDTARSAN